MKVMLLARLFLLIRLITIKSQQTNPLPHCMNTAGDSFCWLVAFSASHFLNRRVKVLSHS